MYKLLYIYIKHTIHHNHSILDKVVDEKGIKYKIDINTCIDGIYDNIS